MASFGAVMTAVLLTGLLTGLVTCPLLRRLPEPEGPGSETKTPYRELASKRFLVGTLFASLAAAGVAWATVPLALQPPWVVLSVVGVILVAIDAATTWLPIQLTQAGWLLMVIAVASMPLLGASWNAVLRSAAGAAIALVLYLGLWFFSRAGIGFGDVRLAPLLGAASAAQSWTLLLWALVLGSLAGGVWGVVQLLRRRPGAFAYAPPLLLGTYLAALLEYWA